MFNDQTCVRNQTYHSGNSNIDTLTEHKNEKDTNSTTKFDGYDSFAESHNQHSETSFVDNGVHRQISDLASDFISTDTSLLVAAHSTVNLNGRVSSATAAQNYDPNLHLNTLVDIAAADGKEKQTIHILNTIEGKPLTKSTIGMITQSRGNRHNNVSMTYPTVKAQISYFYTTNGDPLLSCEFDKATNVVTSTWQQFYATSAKGGVTTSLKSDPHFANLKQSIDTNPHFKIQNYLNTIPSPESTLTGQSQGVYISQEGDTFASIVLTQFADSSFGTAIADYNGLSAGSPPPPGYKLKLPPMEAVHNNAGLYFPYAQFMNSMHTALQPYVVIPPEEIHKKHGSFWKLLTEVIVSSIALAVAPYAAPLIFGELAGIGAAIATGVTAGLLDATLQGVAVGAGLQDKFSINSMIETAALGGFLAAAKGAAIANEASHATATRTMLAMGKASATSQLMELATGLRQKFDVKELMSSMASGYANARINMPNTDQIAGRVAANGVSTITGTAITSLIFRKDPNLQTMAAQMLGSSIGNEASQRINGVLAQRKWAEPEAKIPSEEHRERHVHELAHSQAAASERGQDLEDAPKRQTNARTAQHKARLNSNDMQSAQDKSASSSRSSTRKIMDYVDAFNEGVEESRHELVQALAHPVDTVAGILTMAWDGVNATTELTLGVTTAGAHERNMQRGRAINDGAVEFAHADGVAKTRMLSHGVSSFIFGAAAGGATGLAIKGIATKIPSISKLGNFKTQGKTFDRTGAYIESAKSNHSGLGKLEGKSIPVSKKGLAIMEKHVATFEEYRENTLMLKRIKQAYHENRPLTGADASYYIHEVTEATKMAKGMLYDDAHEFALNKYEVSRFSVYHLDVIQEASESFNSKWVSFWEEYNAFFHNSINTPK